ncbi:hypothetical protein MMC13_003962 [Lambiella insularis]|nr:hypothetical protein [Lambiella insularis]
MSALFNFQSLLLVILLLICTSAYVHNVVPGYMDRNKDGYVASGSGEVGLGSVWTDSTAQLVRHILEVCACGRATEPVR